MAHLRSSQAFKPQGRLHTRRRGPREACLRLRPSSRAVAGPSGLYSGRNNSQSPLGEHREPDAGAGDAMGARRMHLLSRCSWRRARVQRSGPPPRPLSLVPPPPPPLLSPSHTGVYGRYRFAGFAVKNQHAPDFLLLYTLHRRAGAPSGSARPGAPQTALAGTGLC